MKRIVAQGPLSGLAAFPFFSLGGYACFSAQDLETPQGRTTGPALPFPHIGDFRNWKDHDAYKEAFDRLLRDLKAEKAVVSEKL